MSTEKECACNGAPKLIFACSGAADVGAVADRAARLLAREGAGKMYCLAGIGGRIPGILKSTEAAAKVLAIDGCPISCARATLAQAGFKDFAHLAVADLGLEKGKTAVTEANIEAVAAKGRDILSAE